MKKYVLMHPETKSYVKTGRDLSADAEKKDATVFSKKRLDDFIELEGSVAMLALNKKLLNGPDSKSVWGRYKKLEDELLKKEGYDVVFEDLGKFQVIEV